MNNGLEKVDNSVNSNDVYQIIENKVFPKEQAVEWYTRYYGEEYRPYITQRLNEMDILFYAKDIFAFRVMDLFKEEAREKGITEAQYMDDVKVFVEKSRIIQRLITTSQKENGEISYSSTSSTLKENIDKLTSLIELYPKSIKKMGFDFSDIKKVKIQNLINKDVEFYDISSREVQDFFVYAEAGIEKGTDYIEDFNVDRFLDVYNKINKNSKQFISFNYYSGCGIYIDTDEHDFFENGKQKELFVDKFKIDVSEFDEEAARQEIENKIREKNPFVFEKAKGLKSLFKSSKQQQVQQLQAYERFIQQEVDLKLESKIFNWKKEKEKELENEKEIFYQNLKLALNVKPPLYSMDKRVSEEFIKSINFIFNAQYSSLNEILNDKELNVFLGLIESFNRAKIEKIKEDTKGKFALSEKQKAELFNAKNKFDSKSSLTAAYYNNNRDIMSVPLSGKLALESGLHEGNHGLSLYVGEDCLSESGFCNKEGSTPLNEIVNEFLTIRLMDKIEDDEVEKLGVVKDDNDCFYRSAIDFLGDFLESFEDKLKECQLGKTKEEALKDTIDSISPRKSSVEMFANYIGQENFDNLIKLTSRFENCSYGKFKYGQEVLTAKGLVEGYETWKKENPTAQALEYLNWLLTLQEYTNKLIQLHEAVKRGEIDTIPVVEVNWEHGLVMGGTPNIEKANGEEDLNS